MRLIDPVQRHVEQAMEIGTFAAELGDARQLEAGDGEFDAALLMGPLYHLPDRADRVRALREARRVVRPGAPVVAAAISRYSPLLDHASSGRFSGQTAESWRMIFATGRHDPSLGFTVACLHTVAELTAELGEAGYESCDVLGSRDRCGRCWSTPK